MNEVSKPYRWRSRIRFVDTDASQRIHYTAMFRHFEAAEQDFLRELGIPYTSLRTIGFPRVHVECDFFAEIRYDDVIEIAVTVDRVGTSSFTTVYDVSVSGRASARGKITVVCIDIATQRSCPIPDSLRDALRSQLA